MRATAFTTETHNHPSEFLNDTKLRASWACFMNDSIVIHNACVVHKLFITQVDVTLFHSHLKAHVWMYCPGHAGVKHTPETTTKTTVTTEQTDWLAKKPS